MVLKKWYNGEVRLEERIYLLMCNANLFVFKKSSSGFLWKNGFLSLKNLVLKKKLLFLY